MRPSWPFRAAALILLPLHLAALGADHLAPYAPAHQDRSYPFAPPTRLHFFDQAGRFHLRPFVYELVEDPQNFGVYVESSDRPFPIRFLITGTDEGGRRSGPILKLLAVEEPGRLFLLGTDSLGRDVFSRLVHGARVSLAAGLLAATLSLGLGLLLGLLAGYYGGRIDTVIMRGAELFMALPWLYLLLAVRAALPLRLDPSVTFAALVLLIGVIDWARPARLIRGVALGATNRDFVRAARGFGASDTYLIRRHVLPQVASVALTQGALLVPQYILAEVTLSYFGLGMSEPGVSWGLMLSSLQRYHVLSSYPWMWSPALGIFFVFLGYYALAEAVRGHRAPTRSPGNTS